jgi:hypothetical protein
MLTGAFGLVSGLRDRVLEEHPKSLTIGWTGIRTRRCHPEGPVQHSRVTEAAAQFLLQSTDRIQVLRGTGILVLLGGKGRENE